MGQSRKPEDFSVLVNSTVGRRQCRNKDYDGEYHHLWYQHRAGYEKIKDWIRGGRFAVAAGGPLFSPFACKYAS
jgi:hypothetical protein